MPRTAHTHILALSTLPLPLSVLLPPPLTLYGAQQPPGNLAIIASTWNSPSYEI
ncbi:hypothetical protein E2C01_096201 [Portunus trituberculatus]|uniref:Uncharacterized protein n=1 Tax=Portunus trituberculatus TaxID=210409 RepID=A0A5B7K5Y7_PORTR|nr:hypothetical protein [Portunus trituberculatus]